MSSLSSRSRRQMLTWCVVVFTVGLLVRLTLVLHTWGPESKVGGEPIGIALSLATTGNYADAYGVGVGPTAHCAPLHPILLSVLFRIFGTGALGVLAISLLGSAAAALAFALLPVLAVTARLGLTTGVLAGMAGAVLPVNYWAQTSGVFDSALTCLALVVLCWLLCRICAAARFDRSDGLVFGAAAGLGCLLNPVLIAVLLVWSVALAVRYRQQLPRVLTFSAVATLCVLSILAPWAIRNYVSLGSMIWTRSNFGLELQVSNNDLMSADLERNVRDPNFGRIHPFAGAGERAKVQRLGELAYVSSKKQEALAWIFAHKRRFLLLTAERFRLFWLPGMRRPWQSMFEALLTITGMYGLALLFWKRHPFAWVAGTTLAAYSPVYYVIQVSSRYRFPLEPILFLLAAHALVVTLWPRRGSEFDSVIDASR